MLCSQGEAAGEAEVKVTVVAGELHGKKAPPPPPRSWASKPEADVALLHGEMQPGSTFSLPPPRTKTAVRTLYMFEGATLDVGTAGEQLSKGNGCVLEQTDQPVVLQAGAEPVSWLLMQGTPIAEPVEQYGPFVMNTKAEIRQVLASLSVIFLMKWLVRNLEARN
jgi:quercetin 2,3-dioxygenase